MKPAIFGVSALAAILLGSVCVAADDAVKAQPGDSSNAVQAADGASKSEKNAKPQAAGKGQARAARLTKPWKDMSSLSEEQKKQIADIHRKAVQDKNVIEEREKADIMALLNDQQKGELKSMQEKEAAEKKTKAAEKSASTGGATDAKAAKNSAGEQEAAGQSR